MARLYFRPFLGLTLITVVATAILLWLGTWQYQRLQWKTTLLAEVEQAVTAPPIRSLPGVARALADNEPVDFRRVEFDAQIVAGQKPYLVYFRQRQALTWRKFYAANQDGQRNYIATGTVADDARDTVAATASSASAHYAGYVRLARGADRGSAKSTPTKNRWFGFNPLPETADWAVGQSREFADNLIDTRYYIDVVSAAASADNLPIKRPEIRNNHFDYMLTWYGLAVVLLIIYLILHAQRGRLGFKDKPKGEGA